MTRGRAKWKGKCRPKKAHPDLEAPDHRLRLLGRRSRPRGPKRGRPRQDPRSRTFRLFGLRQATASRRNNRIRSAGELKAYLAKAEQALLGLGEATLDA